MHLLENPFHLLGASPRDDRRRLVELAEERGLALDPAVCAQARADLTNPRNRIASEVAWLPGVAPDWAAQAVESLQRIAGENPPEEGLSPLARANLLAERLARMAGSGAQGALPRAILSLAALLEACDAEKVRALINADRAVAGFPEVRETDTVEEALAERRRHYRAVLKGALEPLASRELVSLVTRVVTEATGRGTRLAPGLVEDLVNTYEVEAQRFLEAEAQNVEQLLAAVRQCAARKLPGSLLQRLLLRVREVVTNWDAVAQPIQLSAMSRGLDHDLSHHVAAQVRSLAVELYNEHDLLDASRFLTTLLQEAFGEVPRVAEATKRDEEALREVAQNKEEWARAVYYHAILGPSGTQPLRITTEGIEWDGVRWPLPCITRLRWGGIQNEWGSPTFIVIFGDASSTARVTTNDRVVFGELPDKLWRAVGQRLLVEMLTTLGRGGRLTLGSALVDDEGVFFSGNPWMGQESGPYTYASSSMLNRHYPWSQVFAEPSNGSLVIRLAGGASIDLPFLEVDNAHILAFALRKLKESPNLTKLSDLLK
jgi:hypothetical protein